MKFKAIMGWSVVLVAVILLVTPFIAETKTMVITIFGAGILLVVVASLLCAVKDKFLS